jgi:outer membrane protein OmpA-like peptidoglycan-associated protein
MQQRLCLPCIATGMLAMSTLGWWAFYQSDRSATRIRTGTVALASTALQSVGAQYASASLDGSALRITGTAPSAAAKESAFVAVSAAVQKARGVPGVFALLVNDISVTSPATAPAPTAMVASPAVDDCQNWFNDILRGQVIRFATAKAVINGESYPLLDRLANVVMQCVAYGVEVSGHTDPRGAPAMNKELSRARAAAVVSYLAGKGANTSQLTAVGYGAERMLDSNTTPAAFAANRRIEFTVKNPQQ